MAFRYVKTYERGDADARFLEGKWFSPPLSTVNDLVSCRTLCLDGAHPYGTGRCEGFVFAVNGCTNWPTAKCFLYDGDNHGNDANMQVTQHPFDSAASCACGYGDGCDTFQRHEEEHSDSMHILLLITSALQMIIMLASVACICWGRCKRTQSWQLSLPFLQSSELSSGSAQVATNAAV